jgi:hypothetical protein
MRRWNWLIKKQDGSGEEFYKEGGRENVASNGELWECEVTRKEREEPEGKGGGTYDFIEGP